jgi:peptidoglycan hydrolase-like protein with peptidoglycan-binding domain
MRHEQWRLKKAERSEQTSPVPRAAPAVEPGSLAPGGFGPAPQTPGGPGAEPAAPHYGYNLSTISIYPEAAQTRAGSGPALQRKEREDQDQETAAPPALKQAGGGGTKAAASHRFGGDRALEKIGDGSATAAKGEHSLTVTKLQQALVDLGYKLPKYGVDGKFGPETEAALKQFQADEGLSDTGAFDQATLEKLQARFDSGAPYLDNATFDKKHPGAGTRKLSAADKKAVRDAMVPQRGVSGGSATFQEEVGGEKYGDRIRAGLDAVIKALHKELFEDKEPLRADPAANFHDWSVLEATAAASKDVTDALYGTYATGPAMTAAAGNFVDQWEDEIARNKKLKPAEKQNKAREKVWYLINSNCDEINAEHSAVPSDAAEQAILTPIVESFVDTPEKVQIMLETDIGWEGAQLEGVVYLQRYKQSTDDANREQLWTLFHTCIHEYIHSLAHPKYQAYAQRFDDKGDDTRYNTLIEGMDDFFTENVRKTVKTDDKLRKRVEGPYYDAAAPAPSVDPGVYPSVEQAEQVVSIIGIRNAQSAYFRGRVDLIGG